MKKKILAVFLMCICVLSLCGCANVSYTDYIFSDGSIAQQIVVTLDENKLTSSGLTMSDVQNDICNYAHAFYNEKLNQFKSAVDDPSIKLFVLTNHTFNATYSKNVVNIYIKFNNINCYYYFYKHQLPDENDSSGVVTDNGFYEKDSTTSQTVFYDLNNNSVATAWLTYFSSKMPNVSFANCTYNYTYSTPYEKIHSDADAVYYDDYGNVSHTWSFKSTDLTGENATTGGKITLYTIGIKSPLWYFVAVGATAILVAVLYVFCHVKDKNKKATFNQGTTNIQIK